MSIWHCDICDIDIDSRGRPGHQRSAKHIRLANKQKEETDNENVSQSKELPEQPEERDPPMVHDNPTKTDEKVVSLGPAGKPKKEKNNIGEIRIVDHTDIKEPKKEDTSDKVMNFLTDPKNQALISTIGSLLQTLIAQKNPTPPVQKPKYGFDRDTGEPIDF